MGEKDVVEKVLESYDDVFADIVNVLLFDGREVIRAGELEEQAPRAVYKSDGRIREMERDVAKRWKNQNVRIACVGLENQTTVDPDMPLRVMAYDGAEYRAELNSGRKERYPVLTLTLYYGCESRWNGPLRLLERVEVPEEFRPYVNDYVINLHEIAYLPEEKVKAFQSDFRIVAEYFVNKQKGTLQNCRVERRFDHARETLELLRVMTRDARFEDVYNAEESEVLKSMCEVIDKFIEDGRTEGRAEGRIEGRAEGRIEGRAEGRAEGRIEGRAEGRTEGRTMMRGLMKRLFADGRMSDAERAVEDEAYCQILLGEYGLLTE